MFLIAHSIILVTSSLKPLHLIREQTDASLKYEGYSYSASSVDISRTNSGHSQRLLDSD